jgi:hypothetical protein
VSALKVHIVCTVREVEEVRRDVRTLKRGRVPGMPLQTPLASPRSPAVISDWARGIETLQADDLGDGASCGTPGTIVGGTILSCDSLEQFTRDAIYMLHKWVAPNQ